MDLVHKYKNEVHENQLSFKPVYLRLDSKEAKKHLDEVNHNANIRIEHETLLRICSRIEHDFKKLNKEYFKVVVQAITTKDYEPLSQITMKLVFLECVRNGQSDFKWTIYGTGKAKCYKSEAQEIHSGKGRYAYKVFDLYPDFKNMTYNKELSCAFYDANELKVKAVEKSAFSNHAEEDKNSH